MSRIDEALSRAAGSADAAEATHAGSPEWDRSGARSPRAASLSRQESFRAAWTFEPALPLAGDDKAVVGSGGAWDPGVLFGDFAPDVVERLVVHRAEDPDPAMAACVEQYRKLAATLHNAQIEHGIKVILLTSAVPGEGKTLTATNLALTLSESYRRKVLLVDADLRHPTLHEIFQVPSVTGFNEGPIERSDRPFSVIEITSHLTLLPSGRPEADPMSVLTSRRTRRIFEEASQRFDWVIVDAPPVGLLTDANLLAKMVDATIIVIRAASTDYQMVRRAIDAIGRDRVLGVVLNHAKARGSVYGYGYGYDRYHSAPGIAKGDSVHAR